MKERIIIEIPKDSNIKYEIEDGKLVVDRVLYGAHKYPMNYGYFENTLDWDGDPLDVMVIFDQPILPQAYVDVRILGAIKMIDGGETDTKLIGVIANDPRYSHIEKLEDVPKHLVDEVVDFFETYKRLQKKEVKITGVEGIEYAKKELEECKELYSKYSNLPKDEFIAKMKQENPGKYEN